VSPGITHDDTVIEKDVAEGIKIVLVPFARITQSRAVSMIRAHPRRMIRAKGTSTIFIV
jgi:hypothetical protein